jgi:hypothetical protein
MKLLQTLIGFFALLSAALLLWLLCLPERLFSCRDTPSHFVTLQVIRHAGTCRQRYRVYALDSHLRDSRKGVSQVYGFPASTGIQRWYLSSSPANTNQSHHETDGQANKHCEYEFHFELLIRRLSQVLYPKRWLVGASLGVYNQSTKALGLTSG